MTQAGWQQSHPHSHLWPRLLNQTISHHKSVQTACFFPKFITDDNKNLLHHRMFLMLQVEKEITRIQSRFCKVIFNHLSTTFFKILLLLLPKDHFPQVIPDNLQVLSTSLVNFHYLSFKFHFKIQRETYLRYICLAQNRKCILTLLVSVRTNK